MELEPKFKIRESFILESKLNIYNTNPTNTPKDDSDINFTIKHHREQLISKRKEFIHNYRKKQRMLFLMESSQKNEKKNKINYNKDEISIEDIKEEPDPISRIILLKKYIVSNESQINIDFINNYINSIKEWFKDYKKYLFDFGNKNITKQIIVNKSIIYNILSLLFEPEENPLMDEFDYEFLFNINNFCFYYLKLENSSNIKYIKFYLYILFLLNNLIVVHPDEELIKATIDIKNIIQIIYKKFFYFVTNNSNIYNIQNNNINNINQCNEFELLEFAFLKLIENCINYLHLRDNDIKELLSILLSLLYYNYYHNNNKLIIYCLECLTIINHSYLLFDNNHYNNFVITLINGLFKNYNNNIFNSDLIQTQNKLIFELYLQRLILLLNFNIIDNDKIILNIDLFLREEIIIFLKKYLYYFYHSLINPNNKKEITKYELKIIIKIIKIFCVYFDLISLNNNYNTYILVKNKIAKFLCTFFITKDNEISFSLYNILICIFTSLVKSNDKYSNKICNLIINLFNNIFPLTNIDLYKKDHYLIDIQKYLIDPKINIHQKLLIYFNIETYPFFVQNLLEFINKILFFSEQCDSYENGKNCLFERIKKDLIDLNVFEEIENIEISVNGEIKNYARQINDNYIRNKNQEL